MTPATALPAFRLSDPLPDGVTLLEASAGTGKTHTIASLAVRYLAAGIPIDQLLVVTFTRSATGELRSRVRERMVQAEEALRNGTVGDELVDLLADGPAPAVRDRQVALAAAIADFDAATITTIHGFCEQVLAGLGTAADCGRDLRFVEDLGEIAEEVVDDFYLRKFRDVADPPFSRRVAYDIVWKAVTNRDAGIFPDPGGRGPGALRASLASNGRREIIARSARAGLIAYDDQLHRLCRTLDGPLAAAAIRRLRDQYRVVLVDEFQDTDPVQWEIFRRAFAGRTSPLLLIGDPKQAIYSFRGADVWTYLRAADTADNRSTLDTNWRADQPLLDALDAIMGGADLGHPGIPYRQVRAEPGHVTPGVRGAPEPAAFRLRFLHRGDGLVETTPSQGWAQATRARERIAQDLAAEAVALLGAGATLRRRSSDERPGLGPGDLAVLVRTNHEASIIDDALDAVGVPAVIAGGGSVYATPAARHWLTLLEALEQPAAIGRARAAALTPFVGWDAVRLDAADEEAVDDLQADLHRWSALVTGAGVAALYETIAAEVGLVAAELGHRGGERRLTDLGHVAELLHAETLTAGVGVRTLAAGLRSHLARAATDAAMEERTRRLDSDADAVQIQTVHRSKGLEYPIVYLPYLWGAMGDDEPIPIFHDAHAGDVRVLDVGGEGSDGFARHRAQAGEERRGEDLRQAYVALTRAQHQIVAWWASAHTTRNSPLARFLLRRPDERDMANRPASMPGDDDRIEARLREVADRVPGRMTVERMGPPRAATFAAPGPADAPLAAATFDRPLDLAWRRSSYTSITRPAHDRAVATVASEAERPGLTDEAADPPAGVNDDDLAAVEAAVETSVVESVTDDLPMAGLPAGAAFGIAVHAVLEGVDFASGDVVAALAPRISDVLGRRGSIGAELDRSQLARALAAVIATPLGPLVGDRALADLTRRDRLDELGFELPLVGGDVPHGGLRVADVASTMRRWLPAADPLAAYPDRLADPELDHDLRGFLTGSIDLVARVPGDTGPRHVIVDYKTNRLAPAGVTVTVDHYRPERLAEAMMAEHYPLQAVLYAVALHRFLRWRLVGYQPDRHLGGVLYLFVRGMAGPARPGIGVFSWAPPAGMIVELSDDFDEGVER